MRRLKETVSKVLVGLASLITAVGLLIIMAGLVQVLSLGMGWVFNSNVTPEFIETVKLIGLGFGIGALVDGVRKMIRY